MELVSLAGEWRFREQGVDAPSAGEDDLSIVIADAAVTETVELDVGTLSGAFSDNDLHLAPGEERTVTFDSYEGKREAVVEAHIVDELEVRHLRETYCSPALPIAGRQRGRPESLVRCQAGADA